MKYASRRMLLALVIWCCALPTGARSQTSQTREAPLQAGHTHDIIEIKWSPDDQRLVSYSGGDGHVRLWDVRTGRLLWSAATSFIQRKDEHYSLMAFAWSRDRSLIASGSGNGRVQVWDAQTGKLRWMADAHAENVNVIAFSPDGKYIISSGLNDADQDEIRLWRAADGSPVRMFKSKVGVVIAASFAADGRTVKTGSIDGEVSLWAVGTGRRIRARRLNACADASRFARGVAFSPDLSVMAARCGDQTVVTGASDGQVTRRVAMSVDFTETLAFSGDGRVLAANDSGEFRVFGLPRGAIKQVDEFNLGHTVDLNHDGSLLAEGGGWGEAAIKITEIATGKTYRLLEGRPGIVRALAFSPDGETLASGGGDRIARIWDARGGKLLKSFSAHTKPINAVAFSPDGSTLVTCARDETLRVWDATSGRLLHTIESKDDGIWGIEAMVFSPDGSTLLTTGQRTHFKLWDAIHWRVVRTFQTREEHRSGNTSYCCGSRALSVSFSPDGRQILSGHEDGTIKIWDMNGAQPLRVIESKTRDARAVFSPDGSSILSGGGGEQAVRLWDARSGKLTKTLWGRSIHALSYNPDGKTFVTSGFGGEVRLWDAQGGTLLREFEVGLSDDDAVAFSPDGVLLATGGRNQNLLVWRTKSGGLEWSLFPINVGEAEAARGKAELDAVLKSEREAKIRRADAETEALADKVRITFEYFGEPVDAGNLRMAEPVKPHRRRKVQSAGEATGVWLRFHNGSPLPVSVATASLYLGAPRRCAAATPGQKFFSALCDGSEAALWLGVEDADGKPVPYGFDFGAGAILKPGAAVYFSVERDVLRDGHAIKVSYTFQKPDDRGKLENYGSERHARFKATDLPEPSR